MMINFDSMLAAGTLGLRVGGKRWPLLVTAIPGWLAWGVALLTTPALSAGSYLGIVTVGLTAGAVLLGAISAIIGGRRLWRAERRGAALITALAAAALFLLPFLLWTSGALARYSLAAAFGAILAAASVGGGFAVLRRPTGDHHQPEQR